MNDTTFAAYSAYIRTLANALLLADWEIAFDRSAADYGTWAQVTVCDVENHARVYVWWPEFFHRSLAEQRQSLIHELLHLHLDRPQRIMTHLSEHNDDGVSQFARDAHRKEIEICVQRLARILAPHLPLPPVNGGDDDD